MNDRKNIDRLFQEKFKDFEIDPPELVWENIEAALNKKEQRKVIPLWFRIAGVAAALLIGLFIVMYSTDNESETQKNVVVVDATDSINVEGNAVQPADNDKVVNASSDAIAPDNNRTKEGGLVNNNSSGDNLGETQDNQEKNKSAISNKRSSNLNSRVGNNAVVLEGNGAGQKSYGNRKPKNRTSKVRNPSTNNPSGGPIAVEERPAVNRQRNNASAISAPDNVTRKQVAQGDVKSKTEVVNLNGIDANQKDNTSLQSPDKGQANRQITQQDPLNNKAVQPLKIAEEKASEIIEKKSDSTAIVAAPNALEELLKEKEKKEEVTKELKLNRWQITSNVAPIYFGSTSNGSPLDSRFESADKSYKPSMSYGLGVQYAMNKKLALRAGVNTVSLEYDTNDVVFFQSSGARLLENVTSNVPGSLIEIETLSNIQPNATFSRLNSKFNGVLNQKTSYVEVPVELTYNVIDRRFGVRLIGGFSTLFLNDNEVSIIAPGMEMTIGEANNLNAVHFSTNLGLGLKYDIFKSLQFHIDPMFKYQVNTYSDNPGNFKPYFLGVYTGLSFRF